MEYGEKARDRITNFSVKFSYNFLLPEVGEPSFT